MADLRFDRDARLYGRVRPRYPDAVYELLLAEAGVERFGTAVDIGCGAGQSLAGLLPIADTVIGLEPAENLREEARSSYPNVRILPGTGEDTGLPAESADLITVATAFYWMDRNAVLEEVERVLLRPGVFATYKYDFPRIEGPAADVVRRELEDRWDAHRDARLTDEDDTAELMRECSSFSRVTSSVVPYSIEYDATGFADFMRSTSYVSSYLRTLEDPAAYVLGLADELERAQPEVFSVSFDVFMNIGIR